MIEIIVTIVVVGVLLWLVETYLPLNSTIKRILEVVVIFVIVIWLLQEFGLLGSIDNVRIR